VMALFITNGIGVNSIEDDWKIPEGWTVITEADAQAKHPDLFGTQPAAKAVKATPTK